MQKPLSYAAGWASTIGWIAGVPSCAIQLAGIIQQLIAIGNPDTDFTTAWQVTLLMFAFTFLIVAFNIWGAHHLPLAEGIILFAHIFGFFAFLIIFWVMADHAPAEKVFTEFYDGGEWGSNGLSTLIGLTSAIWCFIGPDAGAHMSEELKDASIQLPRAMMWSISLNGILGITMVISFCFCIKDVEAFVNSVRSSMPGYCTASDILAGLWLPHCGCHLRNYRLLRWDLCAHCLPHCSLVLLRCLHSGQLIPADLVFFPRSRMLRTLSILCNRVLLTSHLQGFPYSEWIRQIRPGSEVPVNSLTVCLVVSLILACINFGSDVALNAILSVSNAALLLSYIISIGALRLRRICGDPLPPRRWSLGAWGGLINDITLAFLLVAFFFAFWPSYKLIGDASAAADFNWAVVVLAIVGILAFSYYFVSGKQKYTAPVSFVKAE